MPHTACRDVQAGVCEDGGRFLKAVCLDEKPGLDDVDIIAKKRSIANEHVPPHSYHTELSTAGSVIGKPDLSRLGSGESIDEWPYCNGKYCHGQWISLRRSLAREDNFPTNKQGSIGSIDVDNEAG